MGILNKSETNPSIQQGQKLGINSHTLSVFCRTQKLTHLIRAAYNQILQQPIDPSPHPETLIFKNHFPIKISSTIKLLNLLLAF
jgi:hypothetical protein